MDMAFEFVRFLVYLRIIRCYYILQILSRVKPAVEPKLEKNQPTNHKITAKDFIEKRDYTGALTILKVHFKII